MTQIAWQFLAPAPNLTVARALVGSLVQFGVTAQVDSDGSLLGECQNCAVYVDADQLHRARTHGHLMRRIALLLIRLYKRLLSPNKGFSCAYRAITGRHSCSTFGYRVIDRAGTIMGLRLIRRRLARCSMAYQTLPRREPTLPRPRYQAGHCDLSIGDCQSDHGGGGHCGPGDFLADCGSCDSKTPRRPKVGKKLRVQIRPHE